jgi:hypothetical protein
MKRNVPILGFILGAIVPLLGLLVVYLKITSGNSSLESFVSACWANKENFAKLMTLSILANLIPFVYCNFKRYDYVSRGIFVATMLYVVFIVLLKYVW